MINHLWIIMDWNRRWAKAKLLPAVLGHKYWADNLVKIVEICWKKWINHLTLWALSTDNLEKRPKEEVDWIIKLINNIETYLGKAMDNNLRFDTIWDISKLPEESQKVLERVKVKTEKNTWITVNIALIYWWQDEIVRATRKIIKAWLNPDEITKEEFRKYLDTWKLPKIDLIIRTGWDIRHSWFLLYDSEYSEYYFTEKKWPEFDEDELDKAIESFDKSKRNFGK